MDPRNTIPSNSEGGAHVLCTYSFSNAFHLFLDVTFIEVMFMSTNTHDDYPRAQLFLVIFREREKSLANAQTSAYQKQKALFVEIHHEKIC